MSHSLGMHTQDERDRALQMANKVATDAIKQIKDYDSRDALLFANGYLQAIKELAASEKQPRLAAAVDKLIKDVQLAYYYVKE